MPGCPEGTFGINCKQNCNEHCSIPYRCNRGTGECEGGCQPGWEGLRCESACTENNYGKNCSYACGFCQNSPCHHVNGSCPGACVEGYQGAFCIEVCKKGFYGDNCKEECSPFCKSSRDCHHVTGHCNEGCIGGWQGLQCLQVADKKDDVDYLSRFNGVLVALCVCTAIIMGMLVYLIIIRGRIKQMYKAQKFREDCDCKAKEGGLDLYTISGKPDEDDSSKYQDFGEMARSSEYENF
ncbi:multiple epidermal growth factor-like domains protein 10 [Saccostrea cucullata]|uniref:multiple epidermal growth factor-like domains protein 10 n=1 Tax=Saccostrea cuccullata TaxID=36930 RepID=UPI002ED4A568